MLTLLRSLSQVLVFCLLATWSFAQTPAAPDYDAWRQIADRAAEAVSAGRASDGALQDLRAQLSDWRSTFQEAESVNANAIETARNQLTSLGDAPEDGAEPADIAQQRASLNERLAELQAPVQSATVAYTEADGLISGIDGILRQRQTHELLQLGPTPLNPTLWASGYGALREAVAHTTNESRTLWDNDVNREQLRKNTAQVVLLLVVALVLIGRSRVWIERLMNMALKRLSPITGWLAKVAISLAQLVLPFIGIVAFVEAIGATEMTGLRGALLLDLLPAAGFMILWAYWLGERTFPTFGSFMPLVRLPDGKRQMGRAQAFWIGLSLAANLILTEFSRYETWSESAEAVVFYPLFLLIALVLWRLAVLLRAQEIEEDGPSYGDRLVALLARLLVIVAIAGVALATIGYFNAAHRLLIPSLQTLQILALLLLLQRVATAIYALISGAKTSAKESLIPVLLGFLLVLAALPMLALIWGARQSDLSELWTQFVNGIAVGETQVSPADVITFLFIFLGGFALTRLLQGTMRNTILPRTRIDLGGQNAIVSGLGYVGIFLAALIAINSTGIDLSNIALVAGALSVGIGFGLQTVVSNFVSGIILLIERPISEGDWIEVNGHQGYVRDISVRSTRIETFDRTDVIVPNADLVSGTVTNFTRGNTIGRVIVPVGVAYGTDPRKVESILLTIARNHPMVLANPAPYVVFQGFGASSMDFEIRGILRDVNWVLSVRSEMNYEIAQRFAEENIEIPFAQTDIWLRNADALKSDTGKTED